MARIFWIFAITLIAITGCRNNCCFKKSCGRCAPAPIIVGQPPAPPQTEILMPASPPAPVPNFPAAPPRTSGFGPPPTAPMQPAVTLELPETTPASTDPKQANETSRTTSGNLTMFNVVVPGSLITGSKPSLDDLERLTAANVKQFAVIGDADAITEADRRVYESRGIRVTAIGKETEKGLAHLRSLRERGPVYVYADDSVSSQEWWRSYFRDVENVSDEVARIRADRIASSK